jgi:translation initiation factor 6 (eIF-6)
MVKTTVLLEIENNPNIGLYICLNDKFCLAPKNLREDIYNKIEKIVGVPLYKISVKNTQLLGVYLSYNNSNLVAPFDIEDFEKKELEKITKKHKMNLVLLDSNLNAYGNCITLTDKNFIVPNNFSRSDIKKLKKELDLKDIVINSKDFSNIGAVLKFYDGKLLAGQDINEEEFKVLEKQITGVGTINKGSSQLTSGILVNKNCLILGSDSSTIEITNISEYFG